MLKSLIILFDRLKQAGSYLLLGRLWANHYQVAAAFVIGNANGEVSSGVAGDRTPNPVEESFLAKLFGQGPSRVRSNRQFFPVKFAVAQNPLGRIDGREPDAGILINDWTSVSDFFRDEG